jgi:hypothetical protein
LVIRIVDMNQTGFNSPAPVFPILAEWRAEENQLYRSDGLVEIIAKAEELENRAAYTRIISSCKSTSV